MRYKLGDVIDFNPTEKIKKGSVARKISMENLMPFQRKIAGFTFQEFKGGTKFRNGDTIIARITPCFENGKMAFVNILDEDEVAFGSTEYFILRANEKYIDKLFLYYLSTTKTLREKIKASMIGTTGRQRAQKESILEFEVDLPELAEQRKISKFLGAIDSKIEVLRKINDNLAEMARSLFMNLKVSESHTSLKSIADIVMGQSPKSDSYNDIKVGLPLLNGATDFKEGNVQATKYTSEPKKITEYGDYIFGVRATIGLTTKVFKKYAIGRGTGVARPKEKMYDEFLFFILEELFEYYSTAGSGSVYINISRKNFEEYKVFLPNSTEIEKFHQQVSPILNKIYKNRDIIQKLNYLRNLLLPKLLSGELKL